MANILIVTNIPSPYRPPIFEEIDEMHDLTVFYMSQSREDRPWEESIPDRDYEAEVLDTYDIGPFWVCRNLFAKLQEGDYDAVIVGDNFRSIAATVTVAVYCSLSDTQFIVWTEGIDTAWSQKGFAGILRKGLDVVRRGMYSQAGIGLGYSQAAGDFLLKRGFHQENIVTGTQIYPANKLPRAIDSATEEAETVLYMGKLTEQKGVDKLLTIAKGWEEPRILKIAGDGPLREEVEEAAESVHNIEYYGYVKGNEKAKLMSSADVFVLPTSHDTWGLVTNESLYYGKPVVVTDAAGSSELISKTNAGVVVGTTPEEIEEGINEVLDNSTQYKEKAESASQYATDPRIGAKVFLEAIEKSVE